MSVEIKTKRQIPASFEGRQFVKGVSGNPKGRPKGSKNKMKELAEALIKGSSKKIVQKVINMALDGNETCLKMCMDRILPAQRAIDPMLLDKSKSEINIIVEASKDLRIIQQEVPLLPRQEDDEEVIDG